MATCYTDGNTTVRNAQASPTRRIALAGLFAFMLIGAFLISRSAPVSADEKSSLPDVSGLTGKDVGLGLGLTPDEEADGFTTCSGAYYAEYKDNGTGVAGFCLAGVTDDPVLELTFALQIVGYLPTDVVKAYAAAIIEWRNDQHDPDTAAHAALMRKVSDLGAQVEAQGPAR
jgi:hypothetical protein